MKNNRKITSAEIEKIMAFTRQHYVEYYDIQMELTDHLASGMEKNWQENPKLDFEENLNREFKKFGVFGFMDAIESHQKTVNKKYWKIIWKEALSNMGNPKSLFLIVLSFSVSFYLSLSQIGMDVLKVILLILAVFGIVKNFRRQKTQTNKRKRKQKVYLLEAMITQAQFNGIILMLPFQFILTFANSPNFDSNIYLSLATACLVSLPIYFYFLTAEILPRKKEEILSQIHPERKWV